MDWLAPVLALVGTLVVTSAGVYQFRRGSRQKADSRFAGARVHVLTELLDSLHSLELRSRDDKTTPAELERELRLLNRKFVTQYRTVLDSRETQWARDYIEGLVVVHVAVQNTAVEIYEWWASTAAQPIPIEVRGAFTRVQRADTNLTKRLKQALRATA